MIIASLPGHTVGKDRITEAVNTWGGVMSVYKEIYPVFDVPSVTVGANSMYSSPLSTKTFDLPDDGRWNILLLSPYTAIEEAYVDNFTGIVDIYAPDKDLWNPSGNEYVKLYFYVYTARYNTGTQKIEIDYSYRLLNTHLSNDITIPGCQVRYFLYALYVPTV